MKRDDLSDLAAFAVVAEQGSFTRAAAELGMSQSALSHAMKALRRGSGSGSCRGRHARSRPPRQARHCCGLCARPWTRSHQAWSGRRAGGKPSGTLRLTATKHAVSSVLMPVVPRFLAEHPDIRLDVIVDDNLTDIVAERIDAGIRFGDIVEKDMIAVRIGPDIRMAVVGAPSYFGPIRRPETPRDLSRHRCINYRHIRTGGLYAWDFEEKGHPFEVRVEGQLVFNNADLIREAALAGQGLAFVYEDEVAAEIKAGRLTRILEPWCPTFPGYYLYHPSRRQSPPALSALIAALRHKFLLKDGQLSVANRNERRSSR